MQKYHTTNLLYRADIVNKENSQQVEYRQLALPLQLPFIKRQKPQISSVPGTHPLERNRYRVTVGGKAIASNLTADDAAKLANLIKRKRLTPAIEFLEQREIFDEQTQRKLMAAIGGGK
jgi:hypothetical protein